MIRLLMVKNLERKGFHVLPDALVDRILAKHRMRFTGSISAEMSRTFKKVAGAVLITDLELYHKQYPPKIALFSRLDEVGGLRPKILWMDSSAMCGNDSPGLLGLGLIYKTDVLVNKAVWRLTKSLCNALEGKKTTEQGATLAGRFKPMFPYKSPLLNPSHKYKVLVVPFYNISTRANAGQIMQLQFVEQLMHHPANFDVIEPGLIRNEFLNARIIQWDGISIANAKLLFVLLDADLIVTGKVLHYDDSGGTPRVNITVIAIDRKSRQIVWSSSGYAKGDDGVYFFDTGQIKTAHLMASEMARWVVKDMIKRR